MILVLIKVINNYMLYHDFDLNTENDKNQRETKNARKKDVQCRAKPSSERNMTEDERYEDG